MPLQKEERTESHGPPFNELLIVAFPVNFFFASSPESVSENLFDHFRLLYGIGSYKRVRQGGGSGRKNFRKMGLQSQFMRNAG